MNFFGKLTAKPEDTSKAQKVDDDGTTENTIDDMDSAQANEETGLLAKGGGAQ